MWYMHGSHPLLYLVTKLLTVANGSHYEPYSLLFGCHMYVHIHIPNQAVTCVYIYTIMHLPSCVIAPRMKGEYNKFHIESTEEMLLIEQI